MAKAHATAGAVDIAGKAMQLHGGIGYTWKAASTSISNGPQTQPFAVRLAGGTPTEACAALQRIKELTMGYRYTSAHSRPVRGRGRQHVVRHPGPELRAHVHRGRGAAAGRWSHRTTKLSAGFMAEAASRMTGKPGLCIGTLGPGVANIAGAMMCALVENSPVIFLGGQRARVTERRVPPRPHPIRPAGSAFHAVGQVQQLDRVRQTRPTRSSTKPSAGRCPAPRDRPMSSSRRTSSSRNSTLRRRRRRHLPAGEPGRGSSGGRQGRRADPGGEARSCWWATVFTPRAPRPRSRSWPS